MIFSIYVINIGHIENKGHSRVKYERTGKEAALMYELSCP